jgi:hypothetical protein
LACNNIDRSALQWQQVAFTAQTHLDEIGPAVLRSVERADGRVYEFGRSADIVALAAFVDYIVTIYGRERLPHFLASVAKRKEMETLVPQVFGISTVEFEANWYGYLTAHYGTD